MYDCNQRAQDKFINVAGPLQLPHNARFFQSIVYTDAWRTPPERQTRSISQTI